jgi:hypothetical protein
MCRLCRLSPGIHTAGGMGHRRVAASWQAFQVIDFLCPFPGTPSARPGFDVVGLERALGALAAWTPAVERIEKAIREKYPSITRIFIEARRGQSKQLDRIDIQRPADASRALQLLHRGKP